MSNFCTSFKIQSLRNKLNELNEEFQSRTEYEHDDMLVQSYEAEISKLKDEIDHLKAATFACSTQLEMNETAKNKTNDQCDNSSLFISQKLIENKNEEIDDLHAQVNKLQQEESEKRAQLERDFDELRQQELHEIESLKEKLDEKDGLIKVLQDQVENLTSEKDSILQNTEQQMQKLKERIESGKDENEKLESDILKLNEMNAEYKELFDEYDGKIDELVRENESLKMEKSRLAEHIDLKEKIIENLNGEINEMNEFKLELERVEEEKIAASNNSNEMAENQQKVVAFIEKKTTCSSCFTRVVFRKKSKEKRNPGSTRF